MRESLDVQAASDFPRELRDIVSDNCRVFVCLFRWLTSLV